YLVAGAGNAESEREHAGALEVTVWYRCHGCERPHIAQLGHEHDGCYQSRLQGALRGLPTNPDAGTGAKTVPAIHDDSGLLESDGKDLVRRVADQGHAASGPR